MAQVTPELMKELSQMIAQALQASFGSIVQPQNHEPTGEAAGPPPFSMP